MFSNSIDIILVRLNIAQEFNQKPSSLFQGSILATSLESYSYSLSPSDTI